MIFLKGLNGPLFQLRLHPALGAALQKAAFSGGIDFIGDCCLLQLHEATPVLLINNVKRNSHTRN